MQTALSFGWIIRKEEYSLGHETALSFQWIIRKKCYS